MKSNGPREVTTCTLKLSGPSAVIFAGSGLRIAGLGGAPVHGGGGAFSHAARRNTSGTAIEDFISVDWLRGLGRALAPRPSARTFSPPLPSAFRRLPAAVSPPENAAGPPEWHARAPRRRTI